MRHHGRTSRSKDVVHIERFFKKFNVFRTVLTLENNCKCRLISGGVQAYEKRTNRYLALSLTLSLFLSPSSFSPFFFSLFLGRGAGCAPPPGPGSAPGYAQYKSRNHYIRKLSTSISQVSKLT